MTHQMPVPQAAQSPYPLQPEPLNKAPSRDDARPARAGDKDRGWSWRVKLGLGAAAGLASAIAATLYLRSRGAAPAKAG